jgi:hypothetical protein
MTVRFSTRCQIRIISGSSRRTLAHVLERVGKLVADLVVYDPGDADAARLRQCFNQAAILTPSP